MVKKKSKGKTSAQLKRELAQLKKGKAKREALLKERRAIAKERMEIAKINREIRELKGVGSKRAVAKKLGAQGAKFSWKALKATGKAAKKRLEEIAREQDMAAARARKKTRSKKKR